jgi:hypothetical protein
VRPVSLPNGHIPLREPPCPGRQVGEGVSPTLDAPPLSNGLKFYVQRKIMVPCIERVRRSSVIAYGNESTPGTSTRMI